ncbi:MAG: pseudouridine synthase [Mariprofundaceae bacterium]|nr:pseudouridine synthase [Mariprofundaceae bacterium]
MKAERLDRLLSRLGYCSRKEVGLLLKQGVIKVAGKKRATGSTKLLASDVQFGDEELDYPSGLTVVFHKPVDCVCSHKESGRLIYDYFPEQWGRRKPVLSSIGRLDKDTSGLLLLTDDGLLNHQISSPEKGVAKVYRVHVAEPLEDDIVALFAKGILLEGEDKPCLPAQLRILSETEAEVTLYEGRYHQVRRMFVAVGNHVHALSRISIGGLTLAGLDAGEYKHISHDALLEIVFGEKQES